MGGGCRKVRRRPTAFSTPTPCVGTDFSINRLTKLLRPACGHTSGCRNRRRDSLDSNVISHCRIHSNMESPHCQCAIRRIYCSARLSARSYLRCSSTLSSTGASPRMSSASTIPAAIPTISDKGVPSWVLCTRSGGSSCNMLPGMSMYRPSTITGPYSLLST